MCGEYVGSRVRGNVVSVGSRWWNIGIVLYFGFCYLVDVLGGVVGLVWVYESFCVWIMLDLLYLFW